MVLKTGDIVSIRYTYYPKTDGSYYHFGEEPESWLQADQGDKVTLELYQAVCDVNGGHITYHEPVTSAADIYVTKDAAPTKHADLKKAGTTDKNGRFVLDTSNMEPGLYYVTANTWDPAVVILEVFEGDQGGVKYGDLTGDGEVDVFDASRAYSIVNGKRTATAAEKAALDVNGDGELDVFDAAMIYSYANGKRTGFPAEK